MLPKFASHVFHHTQRAAQAAAQNPALRNVLGLQNQSAASGSSGSLGWANAASGSSWGSAGGAKYNTGSRFYQGYNSAGRAVTQGSQSSAHDGTNSRADDEDELPLSRSTLVIRSRTRPRSSSVHLTGTGRRERKETFGVLQTVQLHQARKAHALSSAPSAKEAIEAEKNGDELPSSPRVLVRRNSTAASNASDLASLESLEPLAPLDATKEKLTTDPAAPQTVTKPAVETLQSKTSAPVGNIELTQRLDSARSLPNAATAVVDIIASFRSSKVSANVYDYNAMLHALVTSRTEGQPITHILETYNDMLIRQIAPNTRTYRTLILALCERDRETSRVSSQLEWRINRQTLLGGPTADVKVSPADLKHLEMLQKENNFGSALVVFEAAQTLNQDSNGRNLSLGTEVYDALLRSCMLHSNTDAAVRIWAALERAKHFVPSASCFLHLLGTFSAAGNDKAALDIFNEFRVLAKEGRIHWQPLKEDDDRTAILGDRERSGKARATQMLMYVKLIECYFHVGASEKALAVLEEMMDTPAGKNFGPCDVPPPSSAVYAACVRGFLNAGDLESALGWFGRMRAKDAVAAAEHPLVPLEGGVVARPDQALWDSVIQKLLETGKLDLANALFRDLVDSAASDGLKVRPSDRLTLFAANMRGQGQTPEVIAFVADCLLTPVFNDIAETGVPNGALAAQTGAFVDFVKALVAQGRINDGYEFLGRFVSNTRSLLTGTEPSVDVVHIRQMQKVVNGVVPSLLLKADKRLVSADNVVTVSKVMEAAFMDPQPAVLAVLAAFMDVYELVKTRQELGSLWDEHWQTFAVAFRSRFADKDKKAGVGLDLDAVRAFVGDLTAAYPDDETIPRLIVLELVKASVDNFGIDAARTVFGSLGSAWTRVLAKHESLLSPSPAEPTQAQLETKEPPWPPVSDGLASKNKIKVDKALSKAVDEYFPANPRVTSAMAWDRYEAGAKRGVYPFPDVMGRLIATFGRQGDLNKVLSVYEAAQVVLASPAIASDKVRQSVAWYDVEDQMIVGLAHAGHVDKAHVHRSRILAQGGTPSADAYGALIQCVKETTDDSSSALALWNEAQSRGVVANLYLYNTVISKLSRARKADYALELFGKMKNEYVRPSSVTYGAVIAACCRVGDAQSAETLFGGMERQPNFRPRIPPYNTMIQFYTHTVRDRERALAYYEQLVEAGIAPTAHTYKLLLDCYGTIEPVDVSSMEDVFASLVSDRKVQVQGVHWAALINAYGCVLKDLTKAISLFDSIAQHPSNSNRSSASTKSKLPDALVYEALVNVLVTHHRTDLLPIYMERMREDGVHMTAYIANLLIRGYAANGRMEDARRVFENLADAPVGVAAPNNHVTHSSNSNSNSELEWDAKGKVDPDAPVFREPSTWEAMVRAELGEGNRERAVDLLRRVQERGFPAAVVARIGGIMHDEPEEPSYSVETPTSSPL